MPAKYHPNPGLGQALARQFGDYAEQAGFVAEREVKRRSPVDTGTLRNGFHTDVVREGTQVHVEVGNNVEYAAFVEFGTSKMQGRHMLSNAVSAAARWLASKGFKVEYVTRR